MGNTVTFVQRFVVRKIRRFNVQSRADRYLEKTKDKPVRSPLYEATMREVERLSKELPDLTEELKKKDQSLLENLTKVYVKSEGDNKDSFSKEKVDASPESRYLDAMKISREVDVAIPPGKYDFKTGLQIISKYQNNPTVYSHKALAEQFKLDPAVVAKITRHVKIFEFIDTRKKKTFRENLEKELVPHSFQGTRSELELLEDTILETKLRYQTFMAKMGTLEDCKRTGESIENPVVPLISQETTDKLEKIYMELDIYRKTGKLPPEPIMIADEEIEQLRLTYTKQIAAGSNESDSETKDLEKKDDDSEEKQKVAKQT